MLDCFHYEAVESTHPFDDAGGRLSCPVHCYLSSKQSSGALRPLPAIWRAPDRRRRVTRITLDVRASGCVGVSGGNYARK